MRVRVSDVDTTIDNSQVFEVFDGKRFGVDFVDALVGGTVGEPVGACNDKAIAKKATEVFGTGDAEALVELRPEEGLLAALTLYNNGGFSI